MYDKDALAKFIENNYEEPERPFSDDPIYFYTQVQRITKLEELELYKEEVDRLTKSFDIPSFLKKRDPSQEKKREELRELLDESFREYLLRMIREKGMTNPEVYNRAEIDRRYFSKVISDDTIWPSKRTIIRLAIGLRLTFEETEELLGKAGFRLSRSILSDVIIEYFLRRGNCSVMEINEALFDNDQQLI